eukprot:gene12198-biopygen9000
MRSNSACAAPFLGTRGIQRVARASGVIDSHKEFSGFRGTIVCSPVVFIVVPTPRTPERDLYQLYTNFIPTLHPLITRPALVPQTLPALARSSRTWSAGAPTLAHLCPHFARTSRKVVRTCPPRARRSRKAAANLTANLARGMAANCPQTARKLPANCPQDVSKTAQKQPLDSCLRLARRARIRILATYWRIYGAPAFPQLSMQPPNDHCAAPIDSELGD